MKKHGKVYLVGAGPGDPGLLTVRGKFLLEHCDTVVYDGLVSQALVAMTSSYNVHCEKIYAGKKRQTDQPAMKQDQINSLLVAKANQGKVVVRLKGGDPFVFGRGAEEAQYLTDHNVSWEVVSGVTSATGVLAAAGIPLTARHIATTVSMATGHEAAGKPSSTIDWQGLARADTVVLFMAVKAAKDCCQSLIAAGKPPQTPAAVVYRGTTPRQQTVVATLQTLPEAMGMVAPPALLVVGEVVSLRKKMCPTGLSSSVTVAVTRSNLSSKGMLESHPDLGTVSVPTYFTDALLRGVSVEWIPTTKTVPLSNAWQQSVSWQDIETVAFTSQTAVHLFFRTMQQSGKDSRFFHNMQIASIGPATSKALQSWGVLPDVEPSRANGLSLAKVLQTAIDGNIDTRSTQDGGGRVLYPCSAIASTILEDTLPGKVKRLPIYDTVAQDVSAEFCDRDFSVVVTYAPSQVRGWRQAGMVEPRVWVCIGETTAREVTKKKDSPSIVIVSYSPTDLSSTIDRALSKAVEPYL